MKKYDVKDCVDVIVEHKDHLYLGSYELNNGIKTGRIVKLLVKDVLDKNNTELNEIQQVETSGTFDIKVCGSHLIAANNLDITMYDDDLRVLRTVNVDSPTTCITIKDDRIFVTDLDGQLSIFTLDLLFVTSCKLSKDILWIAEVHKNSIYCGGEEGILYNYNLKQQVLVWSVRFDCGIVSLYPKKDFILVGSYDEHIYKVDYSGSVLCNYKTGGGLWRIQKMNNRYILCCMYEGIKVCDKSFKVMKNYKNGELIYSLLLSNGWIIFSSFYEKKLYVTRYLEYKTQQF